jgi:hypothetical protein
MPSPTQILNAYYIKISNGKLLNLEVKVLIWVIMVARQRNCHLIGEEHSYLQIVYLQILVECPFYVNNKTLVVFKWIWNV